MVFQRLPGNLFIKVHHRKAFSEGARACSSLGMTKSRASSSSIAKKYEGCSARSDRLLQAALGNHRGRPVVGPPAGTQGRGHVSLSASEVQVPFRMRE